MTALKAELERYPDCAIVGPRILNPDGTVQGSARGDPDMLTGLFGRTTLFRRLLPGLSISNRNVRISPVLGSMWVSPGLAFQSGVTTLPSA